MRNSLFETIVQVNNCYFIFSYINTIVFICLNQMKLEMLTQNLTFLKMLNFYKFFFS